MAIAGPITTGNYPLALWPGIRAIWGTYEEHPREWTDLMEEEMSEQNYEKGFQNVGFGLVPVQPEGQGVSFASQIQGFVTQFTHLPYGLGFIVTRIEKDDNLYEEVATDRTHYLGFSFNQTEENVAASVFNLAFLGSGSGGTNGGDGVSLLNSAHPNTTGGTWSNVLAVSADLSETALEDLLIQIMTATMDDGSKISLIPRSLHVHSSNWFNANRIYKSVFQNDTANNAINVLAATNAIPEGIKVNHYFTAPGAWFVRTNVPKGKGLVRYTRTKREFTMDNDFTTGNLLYKGFERYSVGWYDPRCLYGSNGP